MDKIPQRANEITRSTDDLIPPTTRLGDVDGRVRAMWSPGGDTIPVSSSWPNLETIHSGVLFSGCMTPTRMPQQ